MKVDLHVHTTYSDGTFTLEEILAKASRLKVEEIAITDHDTIIHLKNSEKFSERYKLKVIAGVEVACDISGVHILGYGIKDFELVEEFLHNYRVINKNGAERTIQILQEDGIDISVERVENLMTSDIISKRDIVRYMIKQGYACSTLEVYSKYIGRGHHAYVPVHKMKHEEVLDIIKQSGGFSVLAHPYTVREDIDINKLIPYLKKYGLKGIETNTTRHTEEQKIFFSKIARKYDLLETAGSDFHQDVEGITLGVEVAKDFLKNFNRLV